MRTLVTFQSTAFNTREHKPYFINPGCFGDDLARWLMTRLQSAGVSTDPEPGQEDFGWYFTFHPSQTDHQFVIGFRPEESEGSGTWIGWVERKAGLVSSLFGGRAQGIDLEALKAIHRALDAPDRISTIRWHEKSDFDAGNEGAGQSQPDAA